MDFGKLLSYQADGAKLTLRYEGRVLELEAFTDRIVRVFSAFMDETVASKAIEGDKRQHPPVEVFEHPEGIGLKTAEIVVKAYDGGKVDFYSCSGACLCRDYRGEREFHAFQNTKTRKLAESEGHKVYNAPFMKEIQVVKEMEGSECFYGLGDKTGFLNKRYYDYMMWNSDITDPHVDSTKALYKSVPFFLIKKSSSVCGIFYDNTFRSYFDMGRESEKYYWFGADQGNLDYYFIGGDSMKEVIREYTYLTGTTPLPQRWTLGYHQSRWSYESEKDVRMIADTMRQKDIPCDAIHLDIDYMDAFKVFTWNRETFPDPAGLVHSLGQAGFKVVPIIDPGVKKEMGYPVYDDGMQKGCFAVTPENEVYENVVWPGDSVYPDFGRVSVRQWWGGNHKALLDTGVAGIWTDMNEPASFRGELPEDVVFYDEERRSCHAEMHNVYGHNMAKATYQGLKELTGKRPFVITRACYSGTQKYSTVWTGDNHSIWAHLQMAVPQLCNLGLSGMSFVGTDVGGFSSDTTGELLARWVQVGCFSPLFRNHSCAWTRNQEPWQFGEEVLDIYRKYVKLRYHLLPLIYDGFFEGETTGLPVMRPLVLNFENDENVQNCNDEFMIGESLLVAPVLIQGSTARMVYLPAGEWYDYWTKEKIKGGRCFVREAPLDVCPVYVRAGAVLPVSEDIRYVGEKQCETLRLEVYPGSAQSSHYQDNGEDFAYRNGGYNRYLLTQADGTLGVQCLHHGYEPAYTEVEASLPDGRVLKSAFSAGAPLSLALGK